MGKRGPAPTPTAMKKAKGNPGKRKLPENEVQFPCSVAPDFPWLTDGAKQIYERFVSASEKVPGLVQALDYHAIALAAHAYDEFVELDKKVQEQGFICVSEKGNEFQNPLVGARNKAFERYAKQAAKFGWTPADRVGLNISSDSKPIADRMAQWLGN